MVSGCSNGGRNVRFLRRLAFADAPAQALCLVCSRDAPTPRLRPLDLVVDPFRLLPTPCEASALARKNPLTSFEPAKSQGPVVLHRSPLLAGVPDVRRRRRSANCIHCECRCSRQLPSPQRAYLTSQASTPPPRPKRCRSRPSRRSSSRPSPFYKERKN